MDNLFNAVEVLVIKKVSFTIHAVSDDSAVITITESLNNDQLKSAVELGGHLAPNGEVNMLIDLRASNED